MASERAPSWQPDWAVPPGEILAETLRERRMTQVDLARRMNRPLKTVNEIIKGKAALTPETALQLELALGISARFWNNLERNYREQLARLAAKDDLKKYAGWIDRFPIAALRKANLLPSGLAKDDLMVELLKFFRVSSPAGWEKQWGDPQAAYRQSKAFSASPEAVASWLRWGQVVAEQVECPPFDPSRFLAALKELRGLTVKMPAMWQPRIRELCAVAGAIVLVQREFPGTRLSGATQWLTPDKALIQLTLRYRSDDQFWFSFFHEAGHVLLHGRRRTFVDEPDGPGTPLELEADTFARDFLIDPSAYRDFRAAETVDERSIRAFAKMIGVAPGIVLGRLQRDKVLPPSQLNHLKHTLPPLP